MVTQNLINAVDQTFVAAGLLGVALAFFHHWRDGSSWSPLLCAISGGVILFVAMMLGLKNDQVIVPAFVFLSKSAEYSIHSEKSGVKRHLYTWVEMDSAAA